QALTLLNDAVFVESSQALAARILKTPVSTPQERAAMAFRWCLTRAPSDAEVAALVEFYQSQRARLEKGNLNAMQIAGEGADASQAVELAAWTLVGRAIVNLDEFVVKE